MPPGMRNKLRRAGAGIRYGLLIMRMAGPRVALRKLGHQLYGRTVFLGIVKGLDENHSPPRGNYYVRLATREGVEEFFRKMRQESAESRYQLLVRKWFYESGFHRALIAWTADTHEMCNIRWLVTARDMKDNGFEHRLPPLREDEVNLENTYTIERFRGRGVQTESGLQAWEMCRKLGFRRLVTQVAADNVPSLRSNRKRGGMVFEKVLERHFLFQVKRTTLERFDPPVPIPIPGEDDQPGQR